MKIRLTRIGRVKRPFYRVVAASDKAPRDGKFIERVGTYDPMNKQIKFSTYIMDKWLSLGAYLQF